MIVLDDLRAEVPIDPVQYVGLKGSLVNHLLIDLYDRVLSKLDKGRSVVILGIDFEKAFNRLSHHECLAQLKKLGASPRSLALVRAFLTGRSMRVRVGDILSDPRSLRGGSPQGSILGCLLYCVTTQQLNTSLLPAGPLPPQPLMMNAALHHTPDQVTKDGEPGLWILEWYGGVSPKSSPSSASGSSPPGLLPNDRDVDVLPEQAESEVESFRYVDDTTLEECPPRGS